MKWTTADKLAKGNVFTIATQDGLAIAVRVLQSKDEKLFVEIYNLDGKWQKLKDPLKTAEMGEMPLLVVG